MIFNKAGTAVAGPALSKETGALCLQSAKGSAAREGRPTQSRRRSVPAPGAPERDRQGSRNLSRTLHSNVGKRGTRQGAARALATGSRRLVEPRSETPQGGSRSRGEARRASERQKDTKNPAGFACQRRNALFCVI